MHTIQKRQTRLARLIIPAVTVGVLSYFVVHAQSGDYGLDSRAQLERHMAERKAKLADLVTEREGLARRVELLQDGTLERDMIDERIRRALNVVAEDEILVLR